MSVPNTNTFSLQDVVNEIGSEDDLVEEFALAHPGYFDPNYIGNQDRLSNFRNYGGGLPSNCIGILNIATRPFYIGQQPNLGVVKENHFRLIYITGVDYDDDDPLNITKYIYKDDDSVWFSLGASNLAFVNTQRPKIMEVTNDDLQTMMDPMNFYFKVNNNAYLLRSLHPDISYVGKNGDLRFDSSLVDGSTPPPSLSLNQSSLEFDGNLDPITTDKFNITTSGEWFIIIDEANIEVDVWYGSGNDTITISVLEYDLDIVNAIKVYSLANEYDGINIKSYVPGYSKDFLGYISWSFDHESEGLIYFYALNGTSSPHAKNDQSSTLHWETRDIDGDVIEFGYVTSGSLDAQEFSSPTDLDRFWESAVSLWGKVLTGDWVQLM